MFSQSILGVIVPLIFAYVCFSDLFTMRISNIVCLSLATSFLVWALFSDMPAASIGWHLGAGLLVLLISFSMFAVGWIGGGDAKLVAGAALWVGFGQLMDFFIIASVLGGLMTIALLMLRQHPLPAIFARRDWILHLHDKQTGVPYGVALGLSGLIVLPHSDVWRFLI